MNLGDHGTNTLFSDGCSNGKRIFLAQYTRVSRSSQETIRTRMALMVCGDDEIEWGESSLRRTRRDDAAFFTTTGPRTVSIL